MISLSNVGPKPRVFAALALLAAVALFLFLRGTRDPKIVFLDRRVPADWLIFPMTPGMQPHPSVALETRFSRAFVLAAAPRRAVVSLRVLRHGELFINGNRIGVLTNANWKRPMLLEVQDLLRPGTNEMAVVALNRTGPAAVWCFLAADAEQVVSDTSWQVTCAGSVGRPAALARNLDRVILARFGLEPEQAINALSALKQALPSWLLFVLAAGVLLVAGRWGLRAFPNWHEPWRAGFSRLELAVWGTVVAAWLVLFTHNFSLLPSTFGFDAFGHTEYIQFIQSNWALPLPHQGGQMFQAPLYYLIAACLISLFQTSTQDATGILLLRWLSLVIGLAHGTFVLLSLRLLFPGRRLLSLMGFAFAMFLPMHLYMAHYLTNETLAALFISASVYLCLRLIKSSDPSRLGWLWLGMAMGAAVASKFTAVLMLPAVLGALALHLWRGRERLSAWFSKLGLASGLLLVIGGAHYLRVWLRTGHLVIGGWDEASGAKWWQEPGYRTLEFFTHFGSSLAQPLFSGTSSFWDGLFATMWGDALAGGTADLAMQPPWQYERFVAGGFLALAPMLLIATGAVRTGLVWLRQGGCERFLLLGLSAGYGFGVMWLSLQVPYHASVKAFYALGAMVPLAAFLVNGWDLVTQSQASRRALLGVMPIVLALNSWMAMWIRADAPATHLSRSFTADAEGRMAEAIDEMSRVVAVSPASVLAHRALAGWYTAQNHLTEAKRQLAEALRLNPKDGGSHLQQALLLVRENDRAGAIQAALRAIQLDPELAQGYALLATLLTDGDQSEMAISVAREGLGRQPYDEQLHFALGVAQLRHGDFAAGTNQLALALRLKPDFAAAEFQIGLAFFDRGEQALAVQHFASAADDLADARTERMLGLALLNTGEPARALPHLRLALEKAPGSPAILDDLAWVLATANDQAVRNGTEAVRLSERAAAALSEKSARFTTTLAAAYAESGRFPEALATVETALSLCGTNEMLRQLNLAARERYRAGQPWRQVAPRPR